jgi:hypothetical protein
VFNLVKAPTGLTQLFRLRTGGAQPNVVGNQVQPTLDVADFYGADMLSSSAVSSTAAAMPISVSDSVLQAPLRMKALSARVTLGANAGTWLHMAVGYRVGGTAGSTVWVTAAQYTLTVATGVYVIGVPLSPLILSAGADLIAMARGDQTGNDHVITVLSSFQRLNDT